MKKLILRLAMAILLTDTRWGGVYKWGDKRLVRMTEEFYDWTYSKGWKLFEASEDYPERWRY